MTRTLGKRVEQQPLVACGSFHTMMVTGGRSLSWIALKCCLKSRSPRLNLKPICDVVSRDSARTFGIQRCLLVSEDSRSPWLSLSNYGSEGTWDSSSHTLALHPFYSRLAPVLSHQGHRRRALPQPKREVNKHSGEGNDADAALSNETLQDEVATLFHKARGSGKWDSPKSVHVSIVMPTVPLECAQDLRVSAHQGAAATAEQMQLRGSPLVSPHRVDLVPRPPDGRRFVL